MSSEVFYDEKNNIIETDLYGDIYRIDVLNFIDTMVQLTINHNCTSWIVDYKDARYKLDTVEIYDLPKEVFKKMEILGDQRFLVKRAIIGTNDKNELSFLETVATNRGQNLHYFEKREEAIKWLFEQREQTQ